MAAPEHLQILKQGAGTWNRWRSKNPGIIPNLYSAYLYGADLDGVNLRMADLSKADLTEAKLSGADLASATLREALLSRANLSRSKLSRADFGHSVLTDADLHNANLEDATLKGARLGSTNLSGANLLGANMTGAQLTRTTLTNANLQAADLRQANLIEANFRGAYIGGANFSGAKFGWSDLTRAIISETIFGFNDLREINGLELIEHRGPSVIGTDTFKLSKGDLAESFLRGCGLSEWEIKVANLYKPDTSPAHIVDIFYRVVELRSDPLVQFYSCFISYSHADKSFARRLHDVLQWRGIRCWLDERQMLPGDKMYTEVDRGIRLWDKVLLCCSEKSLQSWWVNHEIEIALEKEWQLRKDRGEEVLALIPLNLDGHLFSPQCSNSKAAQIRSRLAADFTGWETDDAKFEAEFELLVRALRADAGGREVPPPRRL